MSPHKSYYSQLTPTQPECMNQQKAEPPFMGCHLISVDGRDRFRTSNHMPKSCKKSYVVENDLQKSFLNIVIGFHCQRWLKSF